MARKISGGKYKKSRKTKKYERMGNITYVTLGKERKKQIRVMGGNTKIIMFSADKANVKGKDGKIKAVKIKSVVQVPSNRYLKGIMFKGSIIDTELGKAKITNRPSQEGMINAALI